MLDDHLQKGCLLPAVHSGVTFFLLFLLAYGVARWQVWDDPGWLALVTAAAGALLAWASGVIAWRREAYREPEPIYRAPEPAQEVSPVRVELAQDNGRKLNLIDLPATVEQLTALADGLLTGASLSESTWTGAHGPFTRAEFSQLRAEMIKRKLAAWNNPGTPARGAALTPSGRAVMRTFASESVRASTTPPRRQGD
jgi:hypothetical protein